MFHFYQLFTLRSSRFSSSVNVIDHLCLIETGPPSNPLNCLSNSSFILSEKQNTHSYKYVHIIRDKLFAILFHEERSVFYFPGKHVCVIASIAFVNPALVKGTRRNICNYYKNTMKNIRNHYFVAQNYTQSAL